MKTDRFLLVAGIGNIFFGDDAFGSEVARALARRSLPEGVKVEDFGIRGYDLAFALMDGCDAILLDAVARGGAPGTLYLIEPDLNQGDQEEISDAHSITPVGVLRMVHALGGRIGRIRLVGCEPAALETEDGQMGLSEVVQAAVPQAIQLVESLIEDFFHDHIPSQAILAGTGKEVI